MSPLTPVVRGTALVPVRPCRFLRAAPPSDRYGGPGRGTAPPRPPARALFVGKPQPEAQRTAQRRQDRRRRLRAKRGLDGA
jgi:hypothetical protein